MNHLDNLTRTHTAFVSFAELLNAPGGYFPSLNVARNDLAQLAQAYDAAQVQRGDTRRAFTYRA